MFSRKYSHTNFTYNRLTSREQFAYPVINVRNSLLIIIRSNFKIIIPKKSYTIDDYLFLFPNKLSSEYLPVLVINPYLNISYPKAPMKLTVNDFWTMIIYENVRYIIMFGSFKKVIRIIGLERTKSPL